MTKAFSFDNFNPLFFKRDLIQCFNLNISLHLVPRELCNLINKNDWISYNDFFYGKKHSKDFKIREAFPHLPFYRLKNLCRMVISLPFGAFFTGGFGGNSSISSSSSSILGGFFAGVVSCGRRGTVVEPGLC